MFKYIQLLTILFIVVNFMACSNSDPNEDPVDDPITMDDGDDNPTMEEEEEPMLKLSKLTETTFFENEKESTRISYFENNRRVLDSIFNENDEFSIRVVRDYGISGLQERITRYAINDELISDTNIEYNNGLIVAIEEVEMTLVGTSTRNTSFTYSPSEIMATIVESQSKQDQQIIYQLNNNGTIFSQDNGQTMIELAYTRELPIFKTTTIGANVDELSLIYLNSPLPLEPWSRLAQNQFGQYNNQLLFYGLFDFQDFADLGQYLESYGEVELLYEFNNDNLPTRIETIDGQRTTVKNIEY